MEDKILDWLNSKGIEMRDPENIVEDFKARQKESLCRSSNSGLGLKLSLQKSITLTKSNLLQRRKDSGGLHPIH